MIRFFVADYLEFARLMIKHDFHGHDPELADVLSAVITRVRGADGAVPLVAAYDTNERSWNPSAPLMFQRVIALENGKVVRDQRQASYARADS